MERQRLTVTLLGHKDHGKSTLLGRLLCDTGSVREDRVEEVRSACRKLSRPFEYAFLLDSFQEERDGGLTIDAIHALIIGNRYLYECVDVPGHEELIKNMLTGASRAQVGILVLSAREGVEKQTLQHLRIAEWLGLERLIVAVNKMDLVGYTRKVFEGIQAQISGHVSHPFSQKVSYVPISAYQGDNVIMRSAHMSWHKGETLFQALEDLTVEADLRHAPLRLPVQGMFRDLDGRDIIVGRIESGSLRVDQPVRFVPSGATTKVQAILSFGNKKDASLPGENIGLICSPNLTSIKRGEVCCSVDNSVLARREVLTFGIFLEPAPTQAMAECGTAETECRVECLTPAPIGEIVEVSLRFKEPIPVERSKTAIGRLALKHHGRIIGVAVVA